MAKLLADFYNQTLIHLKLDIGDLTLSETEIKSHIQVGAMDIYSKLRPKIKVKDIPGNGSYEYSLPSDWINEFSQILSIEYPTDSQDPEYLQPESYGIYQNETTFKLRFYEISPNGDFRVRYGIMQSVPATGDATPSVADFDAICKCAASLVCSSLAVKYGQTSESVMGADAVSYTPKSSVFASRSKDLMKEFLEHMVGAQKAAVYLREYDPGFTWNRDFLTHLPRWR